MCDELLNNSANWRYPDNTILQIHNSENIVYKSWNAYNKDENIPIIIFTDLDIRYWSIF